MKNPDWKKERKCAADECQKIFTPTRQWQVYCSSLCSGRVRYARRLDIISDLKARIAELEKKQ